MIIIMKNRKNIIALLIMLLIGITGYLIGMYLAGFNVLSWFWNPTAWLIYMLLILGGLYGGFYLWKRKR